MEPEGSLPQPQEMHVQQHSEIFGMQSYWRTINCWQKQYLSAINVTANASTLITKDGINSH